MATNKPISLEQDLIRKIQSSAPGRFSSVVHGIGDDSAVLKKNAHEYTLASCDALVEDVHFRRNTFSFFEIGNKAAAVNLSDIAAMGGTPEQMLVSLEVPASVSVKAVLEFYKGFQRGLKPYGVALVGGNLTKNPRSFSAHVTVLGSCRKRHLKLRSTACVGDVICVSGALGKAALGLRILESHARQFKAGYIKALKAPVPRVALGQWLGQISGVHAMMDVSDGLLSDLRQMMLASNVAARLDLDAIPLANGFSKDCAKLGLDAFALALTGGEDYELLFTVAKSKWADLQKRALQQRFQIYKIGNIVSNKYDNKLVSVHQSGKPWPLPSSWGFDHFR